jgi:hypothetical protein
MSDGNPSLITKYRPQIVGNIGLFHACYRVSLLGWIVMPTTRNARGIDIIAYSPDASRFLTMQVKSLSKDPGVPLGRTLDNIIAQYWIIINGAVSKEPVAFVMLADEVRERAIRHEKDGKPSYWLSPRDYIQDKFRNKWERLPTPSCVIEMLCAGFIAIRRESSNG